MSPTLIVMEQGAKRFLEGLHATTREMMKCYEIKIVTHFNILEHKDIALSYHLHGYALLVGAYEISPIYFQSDWESNKICF